jgi:hypothetical protein
MTGLFLFEEKCSAQYGIARQGSRTKSSETLLAMSNVTSFHEKGHVVRHRLEAVTPETEFCRKQPA